MDWVLLTLVQRILFKKQVHLHYTLHWLWTGVLLLQCTAVNTVPDTGTVTLYIALIMDWGVTVTYLSCHSCESDGLSVTRGLFPSTLEKLPGIWNICFYQKLLNLFCAVLMWMCLVLFAGFEHLDRPGLARERPLFQPNWKDWKDYLWFFGDSYGFKKDWLLECNLYLSMEFSVLPEASW